MKRSGAMSTAPPKGSSASASSGSTDAVEEAWFNGLRPGQLDWDVPETMTLDEACRITVRLHGYQNLASSIYALPGASGTASLKVSTQMKADLVSAGGDDLTVKPDSERGVRYVPATGFTDWSWTVTPVHSAKQEKLRLTVQVVMDADHSRSFVTYSRPFAIEVASAGSVKNYTEENFGSLAKYWGPGGAGFLAIAGVIAWWRKRQPGKSVAVGTHASD